MKQPSMLHEFLMSVPSPVLFTIMGLIGSSMIMTATGLDFTVTITPKDRPATAQQEGLPNMEEINAMISHVEFRRAVIDSAVRSLAQWDKAVRLEDDAGAHAARISAYDSLAVVPGGSVDFETSKKSNLPAGI